MNHIIEFKVRHNCFTSWATNPPWDLVGALVRAWQHLPTAILTSIFVQLQMQLLACLRPRAIGVHSLCHRLVYHAQVHALQLILLQRESNETLKQLLPAACRHSEIRHLRFGLEAPTWDLKTWSRNFSVLRQYQKHREISIRKTKLFGWNIGCASYLIETYLRKHNPLVGKQPIWVKWMNHLVGEIMYLRAIWQCEIRQRKHNWEKIGKQSKNLKPERFI